MPIDTTCSLSFRRRESGTLPGDELAVAAQVQEVRVFELPVYGFEMAGPLDRQRTVRLHAGENRGWWPDTLDVQAVPRSTTHATVLRPAALARSLRPPACTAFSGR